MLFSAQMLIHSLMHTPDSGFRSGLERQRARRGL